MSEKWRLYRRRGRFFRKHAVRGQDYDGSRWELIKSYTDEKVAGAALALHEERASPFGLKRFQLKLVPPGDPAP